jgi:serine protease Do
MRRGAIGAAAVTALALVAWTTPVPAATPDSFADLAEQLLPAVVNIATTQTLKQADRGGQRRGPDIPQFPPGSPFEEFFKDFFTTTSTPTRRRGAPPRSAPASSSTLPAWW